MGDEDNTKEEESLRASAAGRLPRLQNGVAAPLGLL